MRRVLRFAEQERTELWGIISHGGFSIYSVATDGLAVRHDGKSSIDARNDRCSGTGNEEVDEDGDSPC